MLHRIREAHAFAGHRLRLRYDDGTELVVDLSALVEQGGVWSALRDPDRFRAVRVGEGGRYLEWPGELDLCADALWETAAQADGQPLHSP